MSSSVDMAVIEVLCRGVVEGRGLVLYDLELVTSRSRSTLRVYVDREGSSGPGTGVTIDECAGVSRELSEVLDAEGVLGEDAYVLEVSSPGIERSLKRPEHWTWAEGQKIQVVMRGEGGAVWQGVLEGLSDGLIRLRLEPEAKNWKKGQRRSVAPVEEWELKELPLSEVRRAHIVYG